MNASVVINFLTSLVTFVLGVILITGVLFPGKTDTTKIMLGIVLMIYGVYRFVNSISKLREIKLESEREKIQDSRDKLLNQK